MTELTFHQIAHELLKKEVEIVTLQGTFTGRLLEVGKDVLVIESRGRMRQRLLAIRIDVIVAIFRVEQMPRGPFGFIPEEIEQEHEQHESSDN
ncbi:hypothetical protein J1P26_14710 [Neobacillus sp. MM2021_6]|uniref:hypothetical protein n=1 Tax=Bacillaceae TaxID=186817 RepID=UPI0014085FB7|nr:MULTISPECIES: hypothetical protein [Bacillaceae]MBO0960950.1 hypothetical protein [Neobacillus sp. MM2021_6]NHC21357.1 hypothetical protein [Bacillus sp. MM2020_4]WML39454.1 hypothetical protein RCG19_20085 [Neobacillus sp. OS1-2]